MEANIILTALNLVMFLLQIAMFSNMCSRINTLNYNDKKALEQYQRYKDAERESRAAFEDYNAKIKMLDKAEDIAAILAGKEKE